MSASLVGSEMCIRDSVNSARFAGALSSASLAPEPALFSSANWLATRAAPVSYTHLTLPTICSV
eukprot:56240-Alexandrium_andersonii.AAC.1